ncbi:MAG: nucleoside kinase [Bacteroidales bacterium]|nr:nucleoside kinase [Bacteroidales bacterium]
MIEIICTNTNTRQEFPKGTTLAEIATALGIKLHHPILGALVNNKLRELNFDLYKPKTVHFIDITHPIGYRMYTRSAAFILYKAVHDLYPKAHLRIEHSISKGAFCEIDNLDEPLNDIIVRSLKKRMYEIVEMDLPFTRQEILTSEAIEMFAKYGHKEKVDLFKNRSDMYTSIYGVNDLINYFYGFLVPSTGFVKLFDIQYYYNGLNLRVPERLNPDIISEAPDQSKLFKVFREHKKWVNILNVPYVGDLNKSSSEIRDNHLIKISEALHEKKIARIADRIFKQRDNLKIILIAGPSSSGKTTFSKRLSIQLMVLGIRPVQISLDNYFVDRELTPKDENGEYDFETIKAIDTALFNQNLLELIDGKTIKVPKFDFTSGKRAYNHQTMTLEADQILVIEGIHGLNPELTNMIPENCKYKVFVSALTQISIDAHNPIPSTDNRLIRRIVRDYRFRNYSALDTLKRWDSVRGGEEKYIFPFQENADIMFNSALLYELAVLKTYAEPILRVVQQNQPEYAEAARLLKFLSYFSPISSREIPPTSILREFLGGSSFIY